MRVGLLGGTFDPPHIGHLVVALDALEALELDEIRFVVAARPPHKPGGPRASTELRVTMVEAAIRSEPRFRLEKAEVSRRGPSYTVDTLRELRAAEPHVSWVLLLGVDQIALLHTWREPDEIGRLSQVAVMARDGKGPEDVTWSGEGAYTVPVTRLDVSSTEIRKRIAQGRSVRFLVTGPVWEIIEENGLYRD